MSVQPPRAVRRLRGTRLTMVSVAVVVLLLAAVLLTLRLTADERLRRWTASCQADGGTVHTIEAVGDNPLITQSDDPTYRCQTADGRTLSRWR